MGRADSDGASRVPVAALMASRIELQIERKTYRAVAGQPGAVVIQGVQFQLEAGIFASLVGPSGCGKTTLLNIAAGLDQDFEGQVRIEPRADGSQPRIGYVFQNPRLLPWRTVRQNLELVLPKGDDPAVIDEMLAAVGLSDFAEAYPNRLSVGMARRVAIARAFAIAPDLLLMDEPFVSLDEATAERMRALLAELWRRHRTTVLFVTHDLTEALTLAQRMILLSPAPAAVLAEFPLPPGLAHDSPATALMRQEILDRYRTLGFAKDGELP